MTTDVIEKEVLSNGTVEYRLNGELHRIDGPALITANGSVTWYVSGKRHRVGSPSSVHNDGSEIYTVEGQPHRNGAPAMFFSETKLVEYYENGILHRNGGPTKFATDMSRSQWHLNGDFHREDGPAHTWFMRDDFFQEWYYKGSQHNFYGPAIVMTTSNGDVFKQFFLRKYEIDTEEDFVYFKEELWKKGIRNNRNIFSLSAKKFKEIMDDIRNTL